MNMRNACCDAPMAVWLYAKAACASSGSSSPLPPLTVASVAPFTTAAALRFGFHSGSGLLGSTLAMLSGCPGLCFSSEWHTSLGGDAGS